MEKDLIKFYDNIKVIYKDICEYSDDLGNRSLLNAGSLFCKSEYLRADEANYKKGIYNKEIDRNVKFEKETITVQIPKSEVTGKQEDFTTIVDKSIEVYRMWKVSNGLGLIKTFNNQKEAEKVVGEINDRFIEIIKSN